MQILCFPKKGGKIDLLQHTFLSRELSHQYRTNIISVIFLWSLCYTEGKEEEDSQSCPWPPQLCCHTQDCDSFHLCCWSIGTNSPSLLHGALPAFGGCTACPAASRVRALALLLRLKRGPMLTVPLRPWEELSIPTAHSIK